MNISFQTKVILEMPFPIPLFKNKDSLYSIVRHLLLLICLVFNCSVVQAQHSNAVYTLQGIISGGSDKLLGASFQLISLTNSSATKNAMSATDGKFSFTALKSGRYVLKAGYMGFKPYTSDTLNITGNLVLPEIKLVQLYERLKEVNVVAELPAIAQQLDKVVVDVSRNVTANGSSALDVLEKSPGVSVDQNGNMMMRGKPGPIVMINGKQVQVSGTDLTEMLRGIAANNIQKIELINNPSAKYDAAGNAGVIDIKLKKAKDMGVNGNVSFNGGSGELVKSNNGGNLTYRGGDFSLTANYNYAYRGDFVDLEINRDFAIQQAGVASFWQNSHQDITFGSHTPRLSMEYVLGKGTTLGTDLFGTFTRINRGIDNVTSLYDSERSGMGSRTMLSSTLNDRKNFGVNFNLRQKLDTVGTLLGLDVDLAKFNLDDTQSYDFRYLNSNQTPSQDPLSLYNDAIGRLNIRSAALNLEKPLFGGKMDLGVKLSHIRSDTDMDFFNRIEDRYMFNDELSGRFIYREQIQAAFVNYNRKLGKLNYQLGLRVENTLGEGKGTTNFNREYFKLFPSGAISYQLNEVHGLGFNFSRRIGRPTYSQLNPYFYFIDPSTKVVGNPELLPALNYTMDINYTFKGKYIFSLNYFNAENQIVEAQTLDKSNNIIIGFANLRSYHSYSMVVTLPFKFTKWFNSTNNFSGFYGQYKGVIASEEISEATPFLTINSNNSFSFGKWSAQLIGNYNGRQYVGNIDVKANMSLSFAVQRSLMNKKATLGLNFNDIFYTNYIRWKNSLQSFSSRAVWRRDSRAVLLNFTYKFGGNGQAVKRKVGSAEEEKGRAN